MTAYVYFIRSGAFVKIGYSRDPQKRMRQLDRALATAPELVAIFEGTRSLEHQLHNHLLGHHARHEWFHWCEEIQQIVERGIPDCVLGIAPGSPFFANNGGRKPSVVRA